MKNFIKNILYSGWAISATADTRRRVAMHNSMVLFSMFLLASMTIVNTISRTPLPSILYVIFIIVHLFTLIMLRVIRKYEWASIITIGVQFSMIFTFFINEKYQHSGVIIWILLFPIVSMFLSGKKIGLFAAIISGIIMLVTLLFSSQLDLIVYSSKFIIRYMLVYSSIGMFAYMFEYFRDLKDKELHIIQQKYLQSANKAGQAEIATSVLHNVGNILTSVVISSELIQEQIKNSNISKLKQANGLIQENIDNLEDFILNNPKGKKLLKYYFEIEKILEEENRDIFESSERVSKYICEIKNIVIAQQSIASAGSLTEDLSLAEVLEDVLKLEESSLQKHLVKISKNYIYNGKVKLQQSKFIHIILNLIRNSIDALKDNAHKNKRIHIKIQLDGEFVILEFSDNGIGIDQENLDRIFNYGFTTKEDGHGFGLHSCANYMTEMNGRMTLKSEGLGKGATFILSFKL